MITISLESEIFYIFLPYFAPRILEGSSACLRPAYRRDLLYNQHWDLKFHRGSKFNYSGYRTHPYGLTGKFHFLDTQRPLFPY